MESNSIESLNVYFHGRYTSGDPLSLSASGRGARQVKWEEDLCVAWCVRTFPAMIWVAKLARFGVLQPNGKRLKKAAPTLLQDAKRVVQDARDAQDALISQSGRPPVRTSKRRKKTRE